MTVLWAVGKAVLGSCVPHDWIRIETMERCMVPVGTCSKLGSEELHGYGLETGAERPREEQLAPCLGSSVHLPQ